jgi:predicted DCC family thiol-disulfide oxidoreductase YuxK
MAVYPLTVFYDGACPICAREMALMKRLDRTQRLTLLDFSLAGLMPHRPAWLSQI